MPKIDPEETVSSQMDISQASPLRFEIIAPLSSGAQAKAYLATDRVSNERVFLKKINAAQLADWKTWELFQRETQILQKLSHPRIPAYIDSFQDGDGNFCLVQKYIDAPSIAKLLAKERVFQRIEAIEIGLQVLEILNYLKNFTPPIVHRDIKPSNILYGDDKKVHLVDFGLVADASNESERGSTIAGTAGYMAPEQLMGNSQPASDVFGLFTTLLHLLTGTCPSSIPTVGFNMEIRPYLKELPFDLVLLFEECLQPLASKRQSDIPYITRELQHIKSILQKKSTPKPWPDSSHDLAPRVNALPSKSKKQRNYANPIKTLYRCQYYSPLEPGMQYSIPDNDEFSDTFRDCRNRILDFDQIFMDRVKRIINPFLIGMFVLFISLSAYLNSLYASMFDGTIRTFFFVFGLVAIILLPLLVGRYFQKNKWKTLHKVTPLSSPELLADNLLLITEANPQTAIIRNIERFEKKTNTQEYYRVTIQTPHPRKPADSIILQKDIAFNSLNPSLNVGDLVPIRIDNNGERFVFFPGPFFE